jgi:hypothetical protein
MSKKIIILIIGGFLLTSSLVAGLYLVKQQQETRRGAAGENMFWCVGDEWDDGCGDKHSTFYSNYEDKSLRVPCTTYQWDQGDGPFKVQVMGPDPDAQRCRNGWNENRGHFEDCDGGDSPDDFDWSSCASCQNLQIKDYSVEEGTLTAYVQGWTVKPGVENNQVSPDDTDLDFKVEIKKDGQIIAEQGDIDGMNDCDDNPNCQMIGYECHKEAKSNWVEPRDKLVGCSIEIKFTNLDFQQGSTYQIDAYNRLNSQYDYRQPGFVCDRYSHVQEYSWCNDNPVCIKTISLATSPTPTPSPTNTPTPTPTSTPTPTPTPVYECNCLTLKMYDWDWELITDYSQLEPGDEVYLLVTGETDHPLGITKARFRVNEQPWQESQQRHQGNIYWEFEIADYGDYSVEAQVYNPGLGWR